mgnify:CR=1 FL=1
MSSGENRTRIVLVRHGETLWNIEGRIQGYHSDSPLTENGHAQAKAVGERLAREGIDALYSSDLGRTRQTAEHIARATGLTLRPEPGVRERGYGVFEGFTFEEIGVEFPEAYAKFRSRDPHFAAEKGESAVQFRDRVMAALADIASRHVGQRTVVVTHGGVVGSMYRVATDTPLDAPRIAPARNASLNHLLFNAGRWTLEVWGDIAHLDEESLDDE